MKFNFKIQKYQTEAVDNFIQLKKGSCIMVLYQMKMPDFGT